VSGRAVPAAAGELSDEMIRFCVEVVDASGVAGELERLVKKTTGRKRSLSIRALLVALLVLAVDDRPLHLKAVTALLFTRLPGPWRQELKVTGSASTPRTFANRYRCVRYLFHLALSPIDPSGLAKNRSVDEATRARWDRVVSEPECTERRDRLEAVMGALIEASVGVSSHEERSAFDGSVGLDATVVPAFARGPSERTGRSSSDPDGGWYVREGDHRDVPGPNGKRPRKLFFGFEAHLVTMGRPAGSVPTHPNLILGANLGRPGADPGGHGVRLLASLKDRGYATGFVGVDRGYTQVSPEHFALPVAALGYSVVMDYRTDQLGRQAHSQGAVLVDGTFCCPAMPEALVNATAHHRAGTIDADALAARVAARRAWHLVPKSGPDANGFIRAGCPAQGPNPKVACPVHPVSVTLGAARVPVRTPPVDLPKVCTQTAVTIAPDVGARHRQRHPYLSPEWSETYATYRNTIEGTNGFLKDPAHEALAAPGRRRVRGIAAQSIFTALLCMAANVRRIAAFRQMVAEGAGAAVVERARRRRISLKDYAPQT